MDRGNIYRYTGANGFKLALVTRRPEDGRVQVRLWRAMYEAWTGPRLIAVDQLVLISRDDWSARARAIALAAASAANILPFVQPITVDK